MTWIAVSLHALWILPLIAAGVLRWGVRGATKQRIVALSVAWPLFLLAVALFLHEGSAHLYASDHVDATAFGLLHYHFAVDGLNAVLLPLTAAIVVAALIMAPRADLRAGLAAKIMVAGGALMGSFLALDAGLLAGFAVLSLVPLWLSVRETGPRLLRVVVGAVLLLTGLSLGAATLGLYLEASAVGLPTPLDLASIARNPYVPSPWIGALVLFAALLRMAVIPLHLWLPAAVQHAQGHLALVTLFTPLGSFMLARLALSIFPRVLDVAAPGLLYLGAVTATYGAVLAVGQTDLRRTIACFWVSQSGLVLAGFAALNEPSVAGALLQAITTVVECAGLMLIALAVEIRAFTTDVRKLGGLAHNAPRMATAFLLLSAAAVGFPGTISFVAEDLVGQGMLQDHPVIAGLLLLVTAVNGITLWRAFKRTFLGPPSPHADDLRAFEDLRRWETLTVVAMIGAVLLGGFLPEPLLAVRRGVVDTIQRVEAIAPAAPAAR